MISTCLLGPLQDVGWGEGWLAQSQERRTLNLGVVGLSPMWGVEYLKKKKMLGLG